MGKFLVRWGLPNGTETMKDVIGAGDVCDAHRKAQEKANRINGVQPDSSRHVVILSVQRLDIKG